MGKSRAQRRRTVKSQQPNSPSSASAPATSSSLTASSRSSATSSASTSLPSGTQPTPIPSALAPPAVASRSFTVTLPTTSVGFGKAQSNLEECIPRGLAGGSGSGPIIRPSPAAYPRIVTPKRHRGFAARMQSAARKEESLGNLAVAAYHRNKQTSVASSSSSASSATEKGHERETSKRKMDDRTPSPTPRPPPTPPPEPKPSPNPPPDDLGINPMQAAHVMAKTVCPGSGKMLAGDITLHAGPVSEAPMQQLSLARDPPPVSTSEVAHPVSGNLKQESMEELLEKSKLVAQPMFRLMQELNEPANEEDILGLQEKKEKLEIYEKQYNELEDQMREIMRRRILDGPGKFTGILEGSVHDHGEPDEDTMFETEKKIEWQLEPEIPNNQQPSSVTRIEDKLEGHFSGTENDGPKGDLQPESQPANEMLGDNKGVEEQEPVQENKQPTDDRESNEGPDNDHAEHGYSSGEKSLTDTTDTTDVEAGLFCRSAKSYHRSVYSLLLPTLEKFGESTDPRVWEPTLRSLAEEFSTLADKALLNAGSGSAHGARNCEETMRTEDGSGAHPLLQKNLGVVQELAASIYDEYKVNIPLLTLAEELGTQMHYVVVEKVKDFVEHKGFGRAK